jgi:hypothetical protein
VNRAQRLPADHADVAQGRSGKGSRCYAKERSPVAGTVLAEWYRRELSGARAVRAFERAGWIVGPLAAEVTSF